MESDGGSGRAAGCGEQGGAGLPVLAPGAVRGTEPAAGLRAQLPPIWLANGRHIRKRFLISWRLPPLQRAPAASRRIARTNFFSSGPNPIASGLPYRTPGESPP